MVDHTNIDGKTVQVSGRVFTLSNLISFSRFLVAIPVIYLHIQNDYQYDTTIIVLILYAGISDYLDGLVARKTNTVSEVGKMIDPVSDKLCAAALFVYTVWLGWVPLWFLILNVFRDSFIMIGSSFIKIKYGKVAMSIMSGKIAVNVLAFYWIAVFFFRDATQVHNWLLYICTFVMVYSFFDYFNRYRKIMQGAKFN
ncbi:MAG: CDP-alcohol phosphatidyltransferase family protein [Balneola sp.]|nr:CDP-alcohol phosphatidyltransferase family protein [Balneola sp.]MBO6652077.1 CDP-alcohol phosphatidyltransferase family protein [Balneola sp.]MBO6712482.1 CDP-alcohol phosphatidyltransferase family protein [Balneola sp.]MBO6801025.1 CDP-alcohol phosphatidyltransferase family protein [Balneola sp.]MBO6870697.1 CDP-alcohol phosphatidyltransferase family protein [Balneola sp.]